MRILYSLLFTSAFAAPLFGASGFHAEAGASVFVLRNTEVDTNTNLLSKDEPTKVAPFVAAGYDFTERFGLRLSYSFVNNVRTTAQFGSPPGSPLQVVVWGHYDDEVHLVTAAPEFKWSLAPQLTLALAPQLNWVASRGVVSYSTTNPAVLLVAPQKRNDEGLTLGGSARVLWSLGARSVISLGYNYVDLDPSFGREAHVFSGGIQWKF